MKHQHRQKKANFCPNGHLDGSNLTSEFKHTWIYLQLFLWRHSWLFFTGRWIVSGISRQSMMLLSVVSMCKPKHSKNSNQTAEIGKEMLRFYLVCGSTHLFCCQVRTHVCDISRFLITVNPPGSGFSLQLITSVAKRNFLSSITE